MTSAIEQELKRARPRLHSVAPLTYSICWGYAVINILLGIGMYFLYETTVPLAVASILSYEVWGIIFAVLGLIGVHFLMTNSWKGIKRMQLAGLFVKAIWAIALLIRCISAPQTIVITLVWLFFAYIQFATYIYFIPKNMRGEL